MSWVIYDFSHMFICLLWFCHRLPKGRLLGHMCFSCYRTYVMILCNWLILWQNTLYLYLGRFRMFKILQETLFQDQVLKLSSLFKKTSSECKILSSLRKLFFIRCSRHLLDSCLTATICRGLRFSEFQSDFLRIRECVFGPSFLLNLDI